MRKANEAPGSFGRTSRTCPRPKNSAKSSSSTFPPTPHPRNQPRQQPRRRRSAIRTGWLCLFSDRLTNVDRIFDFLVSTHGAVGDLAVHAEVSGAGVARSLVSDDRRGGGVGRVRAEAA